jgi:hypothetical protein
MFSAQSDVAIGHRPVAVADDDSTGNVAHMDLFDRDGQNVDE